MCLGSRFEATGLGPRFEATGLAGSAALAKHAAMSSREAWGPLETTA